MKDWTKSRKLDATDRKNLQTIKSLHEQAHLGGSGAKEEITEYDVDLFMLSEKTRGSLAVPVTLEEARRRFGLKGPRRFGFFGIHAPAPVVG